MKFDGLWFLVADLCQVSLVPEHGVQHLGVVSHLVWIFDFQKLLDIFIGYFTAIELLEEVKLYFSFLFLLADSLNQSLFELGVWLVQFQLGVNLGKVSFRLALPEVLCADQVFPEALGSLNELLHSQRRVDPFSKRLNFDQVVRLSSLALFLALL